MQGNYYCPQYPCFHSIHPFFSFLLLHTVRNQNVHQDRDSDRTSFRCQNGPVYTPDIRHRSCHHWPWSYLVDMQFVLWEFLFHLRMNDSTCNWQCYLMSESDTIGGECLHIYSMGFDDLPPIDHVELYLWSTSWSTRPISVEVAKQTKAVRSGVCVIRSMMLPLH